MPLKLIEAPTELSVTLDEVKEHCRITSDDEDASLEVKIRVAEDYVQARTGRAINPQVWELTLDEFPGCDSFNRYAAIQIPLPPLQDVSFIKYVDDDGVEQTLDTDLYTVDTDSLPGRVYPVFGESWPVPRAQPNAVRIRFTCGHATDQGSPASPPEPHLEMPPRVRQAILIMVNELYDNRTDSVDGVSSQMKGAIEALVRPSVVEIW